MTVTAAPASPTPMKERVTAAAIDLFVEHGVEGTSLQMIADRLGLTKAALYYHYRTKDALILAAFSPILDDVRSVLADAVEQRTKAARLDTAIAGLVDITMRSRRLLQVAMADPALGHVLKGHKSDELDQLIERVFVSDDDSVEALVACRMLVPALAFAAADPRFQDIDADELRQAMIEIGRRIVRRPSRRPA